jgi:hypothetical protein
MIRSEPESLPANPLRDFSGRVERPLRTVHIIPAIFRTCRPLTLRAVGKAPRPMRFDDLASVPSIAV